MDEEYMSVDCLSTNDDFESIDDFKWCMKYGGEVQFDWKGKRYGVFSKLQKTPDSEIQLFIGESYYEIDGKCYNCLSHTPYDFSNEFWADTVDEILEYKVDGDRLRDIITKVKVTDRTI